MTAVKHENKSANHITRIVSSPDVTKTHVIIRMIFNTNFLVLLPREKQLVQHTYEEVRLEPTGLYWFSRDSCLPDVDASREISLPYRAARVG